MQSQSSTDCFICRKHRGELFVPGGFIYKDESVHAMHFFPVEGPTYLGYLMVESNRHVPGLAELTDAEAQAAGLVVARLSRALKVTEGAEHVYAFVLGHHIPHLHIHVAARYPGTPREYWGTSIGEWPDGPQGGDEEIARVSERLRKYLEQEHSPTKIPT